MKKLIMPFLAYPLFWLSYFFSKYFFTKRNQIEIVGRENLKGGNGNLYVSVHQTLIDSLLIGYGITSIKELMFFQNRIAYNTPDVFNFSKNASFYIKFLVEVLHCIPITRSSKNKEEKENKEEKLEISKEEINKLISILKKGNLIIFFAGTRERNDNIEKCKSGPARIISEEIHKNVIPIVLVNIKRIMPVIEEGYEQDFNFKRIFKVKNIKGKMIIGKPINFSDIFKSEISEGIKKKLIKKRIENSIISLKQQY